MQPYDSSVCHTLDEALIVHTAAALLLPTLLRRPGALLIGSSAGPDGELERVKFLRNLLLQPDSNWSVL